MAELIIRGGTVVTADGRQTADVRSPAAASSPSKRSCPRTPTRTRSMPPACSCCRALSMSTPTRASQLTSCRIASSRTRSRRPTAERRPSWPSTTRALGRSRPVRCPRTSPPGNARPVRFSGRLRGQPRAPTDHTDLEREIPAAIDAGVPTFKAFMVYDFALPGLAGDCASRHGRPRGFARGPRRGQARWRRTSPRCWPTARPRRAITPSRARRTWRPTARAGRSSWRARPTRPSISSTFRVGPLWTRSAARAKRASRSMPRHARTSWRSTSRVTRL